MFTTDSWTTDGATRDQSQPTPGKSRPVYVAVSTASDGRTALVRLRHLLNHDDLPAEIAADALTTYADSTGAAFGHVIGFVG
ncbi:hypothetical protein AB0E71_38905, partial [Streptomyces narbonensis]|uniref:hypothetical protein n=1 Tax=Streptomyces narbonensis TaxID=67333 RepID=UPI0033E21938